VNLGCDKTGLAACLHGDLLALTGLDVGRILVGHLADEVGRRRRPCTVNVVEVEFAGRRRRQRGRPGKVGDARREGLAL